MAWGRPTQKTVVTPPYEDEYQRPGGGLFGLNGEPAVEGSEGAGPTDQYDVSAPGEGYPTGYQPPADTGGGTPLDPSTATPMPFPSMETPLDPSTAIPMPFPSSGDDTRDYGVPTRARNTSPQLVAGVPTSMATFRPRLPGEARRPRLGLDRRAALLRALGIG